MDPDVLHDRRLGLKDLLQGQKLALPLPRGQPHAAQEAHRRHRGLPAGPGGRGRTGELNKITLEFQV